ncbi:aminomethyl-transferring glycine dehydrogenase subunit GcvPA [Halodesulfovibrio sp.]|jgi:glycine dehydrogenase subunit 1|uniref:aminomethyl-transferring glycine dehydrogenase subunit GcvPA n=1 Tax=Halodesulfovibrio sp. TaxID=1912772 RepID=UPI0025F2BB3B|nr:aminomethyl-transferring glycine dehydrogenase subunit GcvPA [Halodesulfovibrio sp.]MCT4628118.1 aminomethyl-transferring glycine dehydrogenase subunit GcvPA [Halodesulfovibrio sp.]
MPFTPHTAEEVQAMLDVIGVRTIEDLFADIPADMRPKSFDLPQGLSEMETCAYLEQLAGKNNTDLVSFLGAGFYNHYIPKAIDNLVGRGEFYTAYTPYQPESSQGTLQAIFEFQTAICRLLEMDVANASVYDGGTAIFEAMMMAVRAGRKRKKIVIDESISPIYREMLDTYTNNIDVDVVVVPHTEGLSNVEALKAAIDGDCAGVVVQNPNFFGNVQDFTELFEHAHANKALGIISVYPVMQSVMKTPGEMGADIAVAEAQSLGQPLSFGGPYLGVMSCSKKMIRQIPGRIVGRTEDIDGKTGYVLTLQAREQHIRRAKATSNICSNQALCALRALIHMSLLGPEGLIRTAELSMERAHYLADRLTMIEGVELLNGAPFGNEFAIRLPIKAEEAIEALMDKGFVTGFPVGRYYEDMDDVLLVACTELHSFEQIGVFTELLGGIL